MLQATKLKFQYGILADERTYAVRDKICLFKTTTSSTKCASELVRLNHWQRPSS